MDRRRGDSACRVAHAGACGRSQRHLAGSGAARLQDHAVPLRADRVRVERLPDGQRRPGLDRLQDDPGLHPGAAAGASPVRSGLPDRDPALRRLSAARTPRTTSSSRAARWISRAGSRSPSRKTSRTPMSRPNSELTGPIESTTKYRGALDRVRPDATVFDRPGLHVDSCELLAEHRCRGPRSQRAPGGPHRVLQDPAQDRPARELRLRPEGFQKRQRPQPQSLPVPGRRAGRHHVAAVEHAARWLREPAAGPERPDQVQRAGGQRRHHLSRHRAHQASPCTSSVRRRSRYSSRTSGTSATSPRSRSSISSRPSSWSPGESSAGRTTIRTRGRRSTSHRTGGGTGSSVPPSGRSTRSRSGWP